MLLHCLASMHFLDERDDNLQLLDVAFKLVRHDLDIVRHGGVQHVAPELLARRVQIGNAHGVVFPIDDGWASVFTLAPGFPGPVVDFDGHDY